MDNIEGFESLDRDIRIVQLEVYMNACYEEQEVTEIVLEHIEEEAIMRMPSIENYYNPELLEIMKKISEQNDDVLEERDSSFLEEQRKYFEALDQQTRTRKIIPLEVPLTKGDITEHFFEMIELYKTMYNLPTIDISQHNWNVFLNSIYEILSACKEAHQFQEIIESITKRVFAEALVKELDSIQLDYLIYYINFLDEFGIDKTNIDLIIDKIENDREKAKIIKFPSKK